MHRKLGRHLNGNEFPARFEFPLLRDSAAMPERCDSNHEVPTSPVTSTVSQTHGNVISPQPGQPP